MMEAKFGSFKWIQQNQGQLTLQEKMTVIRKAMIPSLINMLKTQLKLGETYQQIQSLEQIILPDTILVKEALDCLTRQQNVEILNHSWRSYFWGCALGIGQNKQIDHEALLTAALCHDLGLLDSLSNHQQDTVSCQCFTYKSALIFQNIAHKVGCSVQKEQLIKDAICMHMNGYIDESNPTEVTLLQYGAACDVIGDQYFKLPQHYREQVLMQYPRSTFNQDFKKILKQDAKIHKNTRTALLMPLGLSVMMGLNPYDR